MRQTEYLQWYLTRQYGFTRGYTIVPKYTEVNAARSVEDLVCMVTSEGNRLLIPSGWVLECLWNKRPPGMDNRGSRRAKVLVSILIKR